MDAGDVRRANLTAARREAHDLFDPLWQNSPDSADARHLAYRWLAAQMGCPREQAHFSRMSLTRLRRAIAFLRHTNRGIILHWHQFVEMKSQNPPKSTVKPDPTVSYHPVKDLASETTHGCCGTTDDWRSDPEIQGQLRKSA
jgi:hypothetical protein